MKRLATVVAVALIGTSLSFAATPQTIQPNAAAQAAEQKLNLTDAQKAQIKAIQTETREKNAPFLAQMRKDWQTYLNARHANDTATMARLQPTLEADMAKVKTIREAEEARVVTILTPQQKATWQKLKAERAAKNPNPAK